MTLSKTVASAIILSDVMQCRYAGCYYAERHYAECRGASMTINNNEKWSNDNNGRRKFQSTSSDMKLVSLVSIFFAQLRLNEADTLTSN